MSLESEDPVSSASSVDCKDESQKQSKISYTRDFLMYLSELDICKKLPAGFDASILSGLEDASHSIPERQRIPGGSSLQRFGSTPLNRADSSSNYSRGSNGRWDTHSSGSNDRDGDSQSDRDSVIQDSGRRYENQPRQTWQHPEHDGLLGSGVFPRPSGHTGGSLAPRARGNDHYQLSRSNEPYHPPRPYKALPHSRNDTDLRNDETFGSAACSSEDKAEEERKRRASFELMRKEQQKALQEKQKHPDKQKKPMDSDIAKLLENSEDEKILWSKTDEKSVDHVASVSLGDPVKFSFPTETPAVRPLVPPGFASAILEKNIGAKSLFPSPAPEVAHVVFEDNALTESNGPENNRGDEEHLAASIHSSEHKYEAMIVGLMDANEESLPPSSVADASDSSFSLENLSYKSSSIVEAKEGLGDVAVKKFDTDKTTRLEIMGTASHDKPISILEKLFGNASAVNGVASPSFVEHGDVKSDGDIWNTLPLQSSKFVNWFLEEEKKPVDNDSSSKAKDLLSLIVNHDDGISQISTFFDEKNVEDIPKFFPSENIEAAQNITASTAIASETVYHTDKPEAYSGVLTCEDLEQSILAEVKDSGSTMQLSMEGDWSILNVESDSQKADVDNRASQHLLSLLQKGTVSEGPIPSTANLDFGSTNRVGGPNAKSVTAKTENIHDSEKALTLETLFGTSFMKELHSVDAPVSVQRGSIGGSARTDVSESHGLPSSFADDGFFRSTVSEHTSDNPNLIQAPQHDMVEGRWFNFNDPRSRGSEVEAVGGIKNRGIAVQEIQLPEEESLITLGDPGHHETSQLPVGSTARTKEVRSSEVPAEIVDKLAALNAILKDEKLTASGSEGQPFFHDPYQSLEPVVSYQHLHRRPPSPNFSPHLMNHERPPFHSFDQNRNSQIKFVGQENIHRDPQHGFHPNTFHHPFHDQGGPRFDPLHHSLSQHMSMPGNVPPPHLLHGFPRGVPFPHSFNDMPGYIPERTSLQGFSLNQANYGGLGMGIPGSGVGGGSHPETLERLIEMELRRNAKQMPQVAAGHGPGIYGPKLDMPFRYG